MRKLLTSFLAFTLMLSLSACSSSSTTTSSDSSTTTTTTTTSSATTEETTADAYKIAFLGMLGDNSFNDSAWSGLQLAQEELGFELVSIEITGVSDAGSAIVSAVTGGADMIFIFGGSYGDILTEYCERFPEVYFCGLNAPSATPSDNLIMVTTGDHEGSFLVGALAAMNSETGVVGAVGGTETDSIVRFLVGYEEGAKYINPDIEVLNTYVGAFDDPATAKEFALQLSKENADVIYAVAGGSNMGVFEAITEVDGLYAIGVDSDQDSLVPGKILTSMVKRTDVIAYDLATALVDGTIQSGDLLYGTESGGVSLTEFTQTQDIITDEMQATLADISAKIASGEIVVTDILAD